MDRNPYEVLGVREDATEKEIKIAYRDLVKKYQLEIGRASCRERV